MKRGSRFSAKAAMASCVSWVEKLRAWQRASSSTACSMEAMEEAASSVLVMDRAKGGPAARVVAQSSTKPSSWSTGSTLFTRESGAVASQFHDPPAIEPIRQGAAKAAQNHSRRRREEGDQRQRRGMPGLPEDGDADREPAYLAAEQRDRLRQEQDIVGPQPNAPGGRFRRCGDGRRLGLQVSHRNTFHLEARGPASRRRAQKCLRPASGKLGKSLRRQATSRTRLSKRA